MGIKTWKDMGFKIRGATGTANVDISANVNSQALAAAITELETTGMGASAPTHVNGLSKVSVDLNGTLNSTVDAILSPLINGTSVPKPAQFMRYTGKYYNGSVLPGSIQFSGSPDTLEVWSATFTFTRAVTVTSVSI